MHWNAEPFRELHESLVKEVNATLSTQSLDLLKDLQDDLESLLATPNKSESARQNLAKGLLKVDGTELKLSQKFMFVAAQVSDELQLDETVAAQLVYFASESSKRLGVELAEAAVLLFYLRRQYILDILLFLQEFQPKNYDFAKSLGTNSGILVLKALIGVQKSLEDLNERMQRGKFLRLDANPQFVNTIDAQREFYHKEHRTLACLLAALVQNNIVKGSVVVEMLKEMKDFSTHNAQLYAYVLPLAAWFEKMSKEDAQPVYDFFMSSSESWRLTWWKGGLCLLFSTWYSVIAPKDVSGLVRTSINEGGLEFLASSTYDTSVSGVNTTFNDFSLILRTRVPEMAAGEPISPLIWERLIPIYESFVETFTSDLASILKEMRLSEEDAYLALSTDPHSTRPGVDLERFFMFITYLYQNRPDSSLAFWNNHSGPLYGFLKWGAEIQVAFISASFNEMLAALSTGPLAANEAAKFLNEQPSPKNFSLTWAYIHDVLQYYALELQESKDSKLDDDTLIVLFSYLRLTCQIVTDSQAARGQMWSIPSTDDRKRNLVATLFSFLKYQTPLYAPIFSCLSGMASQEHSDELWKLCDEWAFSANILKYQGNGFYYPPSVDPRFDVLLTCVADVIGFVKFIAALSKATSSCRIPASQRLKEYCKFVIGEVFVWSNEKDSGLLPQDKALLQSSCIATLAAFLRPLDGKLVLVPPSLGQSLNIDNLVEGDDTTVAEYLRLFPYEYVLDLCFDRNVYDVIFSTISIGIESLIPVASDSILVQNVVDAIKLVEGLLRDGTRDRRRFDEPTLYNLSIIPQLALYWSSQHYNLALAALKLAKQISDSDLFTPLPSRPDRILSVLETFEGAGNVKLGLTEQLARDEWANGELDIDLYRVKIGILDLLVNSLSSEDPVPNFAHYLLGFKVHGNGSLRIDKNTVCAVGSGLSLLDSICATLTYQLRLMSLQSVDQRTAQFTYLLSEVLLHLIRNPLSSTLTLKLLREKDDFLLELLKLEPIVSTKTLWDGYHLLTGSNSGKNSYTAAQTFHLFFKRRAALIEMVSLEFHLAAKKQLLSLAGRYVSALMNLQSHSSRSVLHFLDFMKFRLEAPAKKSEFFIKFPGTLMEFDVERVKLLVMVGPANHESLDEIIEAYSQNLIFAKLNSAKLACLEPWAQLVPVLVNDTRSIASDDETVTFVLETIQTLVPKLIESSRGDLTSCKPLASLLVLLLERYQESQREYDVIAIDRLHSLYCAAAMCIQGAATFSSLRSDLYVICYQTLQMALSAKDKRVYNEKLQAITTFGDRIVRDVCMDALHAQEDLKLVALILLQMLATVSHGVESEFVENVLINNNLLQNLVQSLKEASVNEIKVLLCLFLELAQSRKCAEWLLKSNLIETASQMSIFSPESIRETPQYDVYLVMFQVLTAIVLSMGSDNQVVISSVQNFLNSYHYLLVTIVKADSEEPHMSADPLSRCAHSLTRLVSLTGYTKA